MLRQPHEPVMLPSRAQLWLTAVQEDNAACAPSECLDSFQCYSISSRSHAFRLLGATDGIVKGRGATLLGRALQSALPAYTVQTVNSSQLSSSYH